MALSGCNHPHPNPLPLAGEGASSASARLAGLTWHHGGQTPVACCPGGDPAAPGCREGWRRRGGSGPPDGSGSGAGPVRFRDRYVDALPCSWFPLRPDVRGGHSMSRRARARRVACVAHRPSWHPGRPPAGSRVEIRGLRFDGRVAGNTYWRGVLVGTWLLGRMDSMNSSRIQRQFSSCKPATRRNSPGLEVTTTSPLAQPRMMPGQDSAPKCQGFSTATPVGSKSSTFRVTTVMPCTRAVAAIRASRSARGSGT
ncbi:MAG: hypothetical protein FD187_2921 [bacterium]|nr:MAG: hypothetical protein FD142_1450 [bacterium]KAF0147249.1 MAG: hypothetical protein FD187_2921 [bacterium]KAF0165704.1 MAG: hypothetical protein FD158_2801 [bacterium]TXT17778.1 MAG: hypothetical protein FD132_2307 [bacterium]